MDPILVGKARHHATSGHVFLLPKYGNRHGLVAGATGTGKTVTLMTLAEGFSRIGVPVFMADVKGDVAGLAVAGDAEREDRCSASPRSASPTTRPKPARWCSGTCTASSATRCAPPSARSGRTLLARILELNDTQSGVLDIVFKLADDRGLLLLDLDDLRALLGLVADERKDISTVVRPGQHAVDRRDPARAAAPGAGRRRTCSSASRRWNWPT